MNIRPSQKEGMEMPASASTRETLSKMVYCLTAEMMPSMMPMTAPTTQHRKESSSVVGKRSSSSVVTGCLVV